MSKPREFLFVCRIDDIDGLAQPSLLSEIEEDIETHLFFHPEDRQVDPSDMGDYSYFHPETHGDWIRS